MYLTNISMLIPMYHISRWSRRVASRYATIGTATGTLRELERQMTPASFKCSSSACLKLSVVRNFYGTS